MRSPTLPRSTLTLLVTCLLAAGCGGGGGAATVLPDLTRPSTPAAVQATALDRSSLRLDWQPSSDEVGVTGYRITRDGAPLANVAGAATGYTDAGLAHGERRCYTVSAFDAAGNESPASPAACATTDLFLDTLADARLGAGSACSIAVDAAGTVHLAYQHTLGESFQYASNASGAWISTLLALPPAGVIGATAIAVDAGGKVHVAFPSANQVQYATNGSGTWTPASVATGAFFGGLAIDSAGAVHLGYVVDLGGGTFEATVASNETGSWVATTLGPSGCCGLALALDAGDRLHVAYDGGGGALRYGSDAAGAFSSVEIDADGAAPAIAVDSDGAAHVAYHDAARTSLRYASNRGGGWTSAPLVSASPAGDAHGIALDAGGKVHLSASGLVGGQLFYAAGGPGAWAETVLAMPGADLGNAIALDAQGEVHVCHRAVGAGGGLRYATTR